MALPEARKISFRANGIARRKRLLESARRLLRRSRLTELSLADVARDAGVPKGSAYFFYADIDDLYASLLAVIDEELLVNLRAPLSGTPNTWQDIVVALVDRGVTFFENDAAARQLIIGVDTPPALKLRDRANDVELGRIFEDHIAGSFELPPLRNRSLIFFRAVEIADLMFCLSMMDHGRITAEYAEEAKRAALGYLESYIPRKLPKKKTR